MKLTRDQAFLLEKLISKLDEALQIDASGNHRIAVNFLLDESEASDLGQLKNKVSANLSNYEF